MKNSDMILVLLRQQGVIHLQDVRAQGLSPSSLYWLQRTGRIVRVGRGRYALLELPVTEHHTLAEASRRAPKAVVCLLSALRFHGLTTQAPFEVWLAIANKAWQPTPSGLPLRFVRFSGDAFTMGVEIHVVENVQVKVYSVAKTVADCFKYRHKIGLDVAIEALRDALHQRKATVDELWQFAEICRVQAVIKPYIEAML
ncbi:MAG: type IV toxin-antitoxin system AbiEi family antitoxin domain-containing protein [Caldilineales bacterium]|nr:type IV toxin-antitoxin system AbiEi family antitoxin domain-containing protein [Caldilineales bacterium]